MKPLSRTLGVLSLLLAAAAVVVPPLGVLLLLRADSTELVDRAAVVGLALAVAGGVAAVGGYVAGRRAGTTAWPIIGGLSCVLVAVGFVVAPLLA